LEGQVALVTGGGRGLGRGIALALAEAGADVAIASRTRTELEVVVGEIEAKGRRARAVVGDVSTPREAHRLVKEAADWQGRLDVLVNAAGVNKRIPSLEVREEDWDWILGVNLKGTFFTSQAAGEVMVRHGVVGLTRVLAAEWGLHGVRVNAIGPGYFRTKMTEGLFSDPGWLSRLKRQVPLGRGGVPEDLAGAAVFLAFGRLALRDRPGDLRRRRIPRSPGGVI